MIVKNLDIRLLALIKSLVQDFFFQERFFLLLFFHCNYAFCDVGIWILYMICLHFVIWVLYVFFRICGDLEFMSVWLQKL